MRFFAALRMTVLSGRIVKCTNVMWFDLAYGSLTAFALWQMAYSSLTLFAL